jgi:hypothetical protein
MRRMSAAWQLLSADLLSVGNAEMLSVVGHYGPPGGDNAAGPNANRAFEARLRTLAERTARSSRW